MASQQTAPLHSPPELLLEEVVRSLSRECAFPVPVDVVTVRQTHISTVFLGGELVYKVKKPVKLPFLDFSTVEQRHFFCHEEVRINRPWAPDVYLGVVPVTREANGLRFEGSGPVVDWAVKMRRLPESANLRSRLQHGLLEPRDLVRATQRIAAIHRQACCCIGEQATEAEAGFRRRLRENWEFARDLKSHVIEPQVRQRLETLSEEWLQRHDDTLRRRANDGHVRDLHGDLRLEHVFLFPDQSPPNDIVILDGIEFDSGLRRIDVVADIAFLVMELSFAGHRDLARDVADVYFSETNDVTGRSLLPLFAAYRSAVRAKVAAILGGEPEIPHPDRDEARARSQAHWLWCLSELEQPSRRPALVLVTGLPGTGKSTLARTLAEAAHFDEVLRTDVVRKELNESSTAPVGTAALYSADRTERTYDECWCRTRKRLLAGGRVIVDATFQRESFRRRFLQLALDCGVRAVWLECNAPADVVQQRLLSRHGDPSDADWSVHQIVRDRWELASEFSSRFHQAIEAGGLG
ncbi:MAG: AAA family ATPase, partial [Planctomycetaceae bacterium]|nr:AAA family ATPase [Planctomycetaceae bacterium]